MAMNLQEAWKAVSAPIAARFGKSEQEVLALIDEARQEWNEFHTSCHFAAAYGQKPPLS
jgi:hypothetical protein